MHRHENPVFLLSPTGKSAHSAKDEGELTRQTEKPKMTFSQTIDVDKSRVNNSTDDVHRKMKGPSSTGKPFHRQLDHVVPLGVV